MAIAPTGTMYKSLVFDGEDSRDYGVYISGQAVFDAPERDVEMITIPGRNGEFALDQGRFNNITVSYPAGIFADTDENFAKAVSDFRNFVCSRKGYCRLADDYNPDEYRLAIYKNGIEVKPALLKAGQFNIDFDCKPQRFLTSGETAQTIGASGDSIINPTLFDAKPLLEVTGYGKIGIGDETLEVEQIELGEIEISQGGTNSATLNMTNVNASDRIYQKSGSTYRFTWAKYSTAVGWSITSTSNVQSARAYYVDSYIAQLDVTLPSFECVAGTAHTETSTVVVYITDLVPTPTVHYTATVTITQTYDGNNNITVSASWSGFPTSPVVVNSSSSYTINKVFAYSTIITAPVPLYIDLDIGEAYGTVGGELLPLNSKVSLPAVLPTLGAGATIISFDSTVTDLKIIPRWWKI